MKQSGTAVLLLNLLIATGCSRPASNRVVENGVDAQVVVRSRCMGPIGECSHYIIRTLQVGARPSIEIDRTREEHSASSAELAALAEAMGVQVGANGDRVLVHYEGRDLLYFLLAEGTPFQLSVSAMTPNAVLSGEPSTESVVAQVLTSSEPPLSQEAWSAFTANPDDERDALLLQRWPQAEPSVDFLAARRNSLTPALDEALQARAGRIFREEMQAESPNARSTDAVLALLPLSPAYADLLTQEVLGAWPEQDRLSYPIVTYLFSEQLADNPERRVELQRRSVRYFDSVYGLDSAPLSISSEGEARQLHAILLWALRADDAERIWAKVLSAWPAEDHYNQMLVRVARALTPPQRRAAIERALAVRDTQDSARLALALDVRGDGLVPFANAQLANADADIDLLNEMKAHLPLEWHQEAAASLSREIRRGATSDERRRFGFWLALELRDCALVQQFTGADLDLQAARSTRCPAAAESDP